MCVYIVCFVPFFCMLCTVLLYFNFFSSFPPVKMIEDDVKEFQWHINLRNRACILGTNLAEVTINTPQGKSKHGLGKLLHLAL